jgi:hypothetical protein
LGEPSDEEATEVKHLQMIVEEGHEGLTAAEQFYALVA